MMPAERWLVKRQIFASGYKFRKALKAGDRKALVGHRFVADATAILGRFKPSVPIGKEQRPRVAKMNAIVNGQQTALSGQDLAAKSVTLYLDIHQF